MKREEVINELARQEVAQLSAEQRNSHLLDWWMLEPDDLEWEGLPPDLQSELQTEEEPTNPSDERYDPLLAIALGHRYRGMRNDYILYRARAMGLRVDTIEGEPEVLEICPCCLYRTLPERGGYAICPICFWEDDGARRLDAYSAPNRLTLREGRKNFATIGACSSHDMKTAHPELRDAYIWSQKRDG